MIDNYDLFYILKFLIIDNHVFNKFRVIDDRFFSKKHLRVYNLWSDNTLTNPNDAHIQDIIGVNFLSPHT